MTVSVAIISHNYGRFLREALESVLAQTLPVDEVLVIDDASTDDTAVIANEYAARGVSYIRVETGCVWSNRINAIKRFSSRWVLCLDADNTIPGDYLEAAVAAGDGDPCCGVVYPSLARFGADEQLIDFARPAVPVSVANHIDAAAVYRREAVLQADIEGVRPDINATAEDWLFARRVLANGWTEKHNPQPVGYRVHGTNKHANNEARNYYDDAGLSHEPVTIVVPLSGRAGLLLMLTDWLERQTWPREQCRLMLIDNSHSVRFGSAVRRWVAGCDYPDVRQCRSRAGRAGLADEQRTSRPDHDREVHRTVAGIYNRAFRESATDYVLTLEDDIEPPDDVIERLMRAMRPKVAAASAAYKHRNGQHWLAWRGVAGKREYLPQGDSVERIDGAGFGCLLLRRLVADSLQLTTDGPTAFYDANAFDQIAKMRWQVALDWSAKCVHHAGEL